MKAWWKKGVRFECQGSGRCCTSRGSYGFVYLTLEDRQRFAKHFKIPTGEFTRQYCEKTDGYYHLKEDPKATDCQFLENNRCGVYGARPTQCRTWPFWPENMQPKAWTRDVVNFCPGVGKGEVVSAQEIERQLELQTDSEKRL